MAKKRKIEIKVNSDSRPYVLWSRVSTVSQGADGLGIAAQYTIAKTFMGKEPIETFTDVYSGTKLRQCENLWKAIALCKEKDYLLVVAKSDRFRSVQDALEVLDAVGQNRLIFCDLPTSDRFVLTVMWAMWERQAIMGRINTKIALEERQRQIREQGGFFSKSGRWVTKLGNPTGEVPNSAHAAAGKAVAEQANAWRLDSPLYSWVTIQVYKRRRQKDILADALELYEQNPEKYSTRQGKPLSKGVLSYWVREIELKM